MGRRALRAKVSQETTVCRAPIVRLGIDECLVLYAGKDKRCETFEVVQINGLADVVLR